ncbi:MAG: hypothetical protein Tsb005_20340 [Gammaproteobacteria bacterium]
MTDSTLTANLIPLSINPSVIPSNRDKDSNYYFFTELDRKCQQKIETSIKTLQNYMEQHNISGVSKAHVEALINEITIFIYTPEQPMKEQELMLELLQDTYQLLLDPNNESAQKRYRTNIETLKQEGSSASSSKTTARIATVATAVLVTLTIVSLFVAISAATGGAGALALGLGFGLAIGLLASSGAGAAKSHSLWKKSAQDSNNWNNISSNANSFFNNITSTSNANLPEPPVVSLELSNNTGPSN